ncbi:MAG: mandelate racemase/muconate lactonizing enzyme family protein [Caldilineaceae bacterium]|nr:mandelate racemase/muconate lactonizing enzyme family protein [Caldilineaceae bacterium]
MRDRVATDFWANRPTAPLLAGFVAEASGQGLSGLKMKSDADGNTAKALLAIADDIPTDFRITIDPMYAWRSFRESAHLFEALARLPFTVQIEDPFHYHAVEDWQQARRFGPLTIVCHPRREEVLHFALREQLADAYNLGGGSLAGFVRLAQVTEFQHKDCWQGSSLELGVLQHLRLHGAACARSCILASDLSSEWVREHTLVTPRMGYEGAFAKLPSLPGLGIELDHAAIDRYTQEKFEVN